VLRAYRHHYRITRFQVDPYQFGDGNPDAIRSGAFWFYYRFGFRPRTAALAELAAGEWKLIRGTAGYRTTPAVLRRFTKSPLVLDFDIGAAEVHRSDPTRLGVAVTQHISARFGDDRVAARRWVTRRVLSVLPADRRRHRSDDERLAFERLGPLIAVLPGLDTWPMGARRALAAVIRAKGGPRERDYVVRLQGHARLRAALAELEASVDWDALPTRPAWRPER